MSQNFLAIIDYKAGNQTSVLRALRSLGVPATITSDLSTLKEAVGVIFPGVGAAGRAMEVLKTTGMDYAIRELYGTGTPFLGICLGCQIMLESSEENQTKTLGIFKGRNIRFDSRKKDEEGKSIRVPHMGWNRVKVKNPFPLFEGVSPDSQFYFVHSYFPSPEPELILGLTYHGSDFCSVYGRDGIWALQFHPEKSGPPGLRILKNFYDYSLKGSPHAE
jgi:glutamine amidotransferase